MPIYVVVLYSPYEGYGNLKPFARICFRTDRDPSNPWGGSASGCFAHPTLGYAACVTARNDCNTDPNTNWDNGRNECRPASN
ncbi:MAG: hypothetical protein OXD44_08665 [Gammaproteobacteria bacterium]|nr:hypothetical protein [Gammaproteobacteria bacterium]